MLNIVVVRYQIRANAVANEKVSYKMHHKKKFIEISNIYSAIKI